MKCLFLILVFLSLNIKIEAKDMCLSASHLGCFINQKIDKTHMAGVCEYPGFGHVIIHTNNIRSTGLLLNMYVREVGREQVTLNNGYQSSATIMDECTPTAYEVCSQDLDHPCQGYESKVLAKGQDKLPPSQGNLHLQKILKGLKNSAD